MCRLKNFVKCGGLLVVFGVALVGCGSSGGSSALQGGGVVDLPLAKLSYTSAATHYNEAGRVKVELSSAWGEEGQLVVRGVFTPEDADFHLYSCELSKAGVNGFGRPTLIEVAEADRFEEVAALVADRKVKTYFDKTTSTSMPIYPDGAVTLYLPLRWKAVPETPMSLPLRLTYMACGETRCNVPVVEAEVEITVPVP